MGMRIKRKRLKQLGRTDSGSLALSAISSDNGPKCMKMNMHENELPANYGRYRRFTSRIHRKHGIATPLINNKAIAWLVS